MSTKWNTKNLGQGGGNPGQGTGNPSQSSGGTNFDDIFKDEYVILFLQGKNSFGDLVYTYVKVMFPQMKAINAAIRSGENFTPSDYGTVVAAGKGEPTDDVKAELALNYPMFDQVKKLQPGPQAPTAPTVQKKAWDEY